MGWWPCDDCCGGGEQAGCLISAGWETIVKNNLASSDIVGWTINSGTWNGTQSWESGTTADAVETSSDNAKITCDTQQSQPLNDRVRVEHWIQIDNSADEAIVWMAGHKVIFTGSSVEIHTNLIKLASSGCGLSTGSPRHVKLCSWYDAGTGNEYLGVGFESGSTWAVVIAKVTLDSDGTTAFGTGDVTDKVGFHHVDNSSGKRDGDFYHNTPRTDGSGLDCGVCSFSECAVCPGGDSPRYLTITIDGLANAAYPKCYNCGNPNASYIVDMDAPCTAGCERYSFQKVYLCYGVPIPNVWDQADYYVKLSVAIISLGSGNWKVSVFLDEWRDDDPYTPQDTDPLHTVRAVYSKTFTSSDLCTDIDDDLTLESYEEPAGPSYKSDCVGYDDLDVHVTASE